MTTEILRIKDANERDREGRGGRIRVSRTPLVEWVVVESGNEITRYDRLKDARAKYPDAKVIRD